MPIPMAPLLAALAVLFCLASPASAMDFGARVKVGAPLIAFGDSMAFGNAASSPANRYVNRLAAAIGGPLNNQAVSGTGMAQQSRAAFPVVPLRNTSVVSVMAGFNDLLRTGAAAFPKIETNLRALIANALLDRALPASACRKTGVWVSAGAADGGKALMLGGTGLYTTGGPTDALDCDFFGETLVIGSWTTIGAASGGTYKDFAIAIDGVPVGTFFANGATDDAYPATNFNVRFFKNLGFAKHTVTLRPLSAGAYTIVDYVGALAAPAAVAPVLVAQIPSMTNWTYNGNTLAPATLAAANALIASVVAEFDGWPVRLVPTNDFYTPGPGFTAPDGQHPADAGMAQIANAHIFQLGVASQ